ncbi:DgyrCDS14792 [Dimorphilus gyrociliatus]|uniref:DgyrCDS14792 n=1 Tax=Dimorphilus gyrociliatus TaxID=2664684 RepID=A0A7I8WEX8_9ANNE|nr:DgyrCDS14792 [Dimorphilus gyrociliatus]
MLSILGYFLSFSIFLSSTIQATSNDLEVQAIVKIATEEGTGFHLAIVKIQGTPTCNFTVTKPDMTEIHQGVIEVTQQWNSYDLPDSIFTNITEDFVATHNIECKDGISSLSFKLKTYVYAKESLSFNSDFPINLKVENKISNMEQSQKDINIISENKEVVCNFSLTHPSKATIDKNRKVFTPFDDLPIVVTRIGSSKSAVIRASCLEIEHSLPLIIDIPVYFTPNADPWASAIGDPHFKQYILDISSSKIIPICYDVTGSPNDYLHIAGFSEGEIKIYGQLKDDYYFHELIIKSCVDSITITTHDIFFQNGSTLEWKDKLTNSVFKSKIFEFQIVENEILISFLKYSLVAIHVEKSVHSLSEKHLNINLKVSPNDYERMNGLIGDIGKKEYTFYPEVQPDQGSSSKLGSILIGKNLVTGTKSDRDEVGCWLMNVNDILKPFKIFNYLQKSIN